MQTTTHHANAKDEDTAVLLQGELQEGLQNEIGLKAEFAAEWSARLVAFLRRRLGSQQIYIPAPSRLERDAAIFREFNGQNAAEMCQRHGVSRTRLYEIVAEQRARAQAASPLSSLKTGQAGG